MQVTKAGGEETPAPCPGPIWVAKAADHPNLAILPVPELALSKRPAGLISAAEEVDRQMTIPVLGPRLTASVWLLTGCLAGKSF